MLVLTRKINETITLGHPASVEPLIQVTVVEVRGDQVRPGTTGLRFIFVQLLSARLIGTSLLKVSKWNKMLVTCEGYKVVIRYVPVCVYSLLRVFDFLILD